MIKCPQCNKELQDGVHFCNECGTKLEPVAVEEFIFCPNCGEKNSAEFGFCQKCGSSLAEDTPIENTQVVVDVPQENKSLAIANLPFNISGKMVKLGLAGIAAVVVISIILSTIFTGVNKHNIALYIKDDELNFTKLSSIKPYEITDRLVDGDDERSAENYARRNVLISDNGKYLFYPDKVENGSYTLFCRYANSPKKDPIKISSNVTSYTISKSGKTVTYKSNGKLYQHNLKDKEKVASNVSSFRVSDDGKKIVYQNSSGRLYFKYKGKDKEKVDSSVSSLVYVNEKFNTVYYIKEDKLYKRVKGRDRVKIDSDVKEVIKAYDSGELYYLKAETKKANLIDFVEDDKKKSDAKIEKPDYPVYPDYPQYPSYFSFYDSNYNFDTDGYNAAVEQYNTEVEEYREKRDKINQEYNDALDEYYEKEERDELREELEDEVFEKTTYSLHYFNGKKAKTLNENFVYDLQIVADKAPTMIFAVAGKDSYEKVKLSEIDSVYEVSEMIENAEKESNDYRIAVEDKVTEFNKGIESSFSLSPDGKTIYYVDNVDEKHGDLYKIQISGKKPKKAEKYDKNVFQGFGYFLSDDEYVYFKNWDPKEDIYYTADIYLNKKKIDSEVTMSLLYYDKDIILYSKDREEDTYTLCIYKNGKSKEIADDVYTCSVTPKGDVLYLTDYDDGEGDLSVYKNGKSKKIDDEVSAIIPVYNIYDEN